MVEFPGTITAHRDMGFNWHIVPCRKRGFMNYVITVKRDAMLHIDEGLYVNKRCLTH